MDGEAALGVSDKAVLRGPQTNSTTHHHSVENSRSEIVKNLNNLD